MPLKSPFPDITVPTLPLHSYLLERASQWGDRPALIDAPTGRTITYGQLPQQVQAVAAGLAERGVGKGDVVLLFSPNLPEYAVAFLAVSSVGAINSTANPLYSVEELAGQLRDSGARIVITVPPLLDRVREAASSVDGQVHEIVVFGEADGATPFAALYKRGGSVPAVQIDPSDDLVALPYSSGTTGLPKGVMLTHQNLTANVEQFVAMDAVHEGDVVLGVLPLYHIYGLNVIMNGCLRLGLPIVLMPRFDLEAFLRTMQDYKVTVAYLVPPIILALAKHPLVDQFDLSSLRMIFSGAAPLGEDLEAACAERLHVHLQQGYGMTETSPVTHTSTINSAVPGSVGFIAPSTECKVVDLTTGAELPAGEQGEIAVRGPQIMKGYLNNPEATARTIDADGWLHTGDIGYYDQQGHFFVVDRAKELIKYKGYQVPPAELEAILLTNPRIADAAVIPVADEEAGEVPKGLVVKRGDITEQEVMDFLAGHVAPYKKLRYVEFVDAIPKSTSGKILRRTLIERERERAAATRG